MASLCRSALMAGSRSISSRSRILTQSSLNALNPKPMSSPFASSAKPMSSATRFFSVLGSSESMMPLHSAVASARLKSNIAFDSTCWSCLSQGLNWSIGAENSTEPARVVSVPDVHNHRFLVEASSPSFIGFWSSSGRLAHT